MKSLLLPALLLLSPSLWADKLDIHYGINNVDINADGVPDLIVRTRWENGNAHSFDRYLVAIRKDEAVYEVPLGTTYDYRIQTNEGAECLRQGYLFRLNAAKMLEVVKYALEGGVQSYCEPRRMTTSTYRLSASDGDVGVPYFYLKEIEKRTEEKLTPDVSEFIQ